MSVTQQREAEVATIVESLVAAWNVHDAAGFAAAFHENADFTNVFGMSAEGRGAIERFHAPIFETMFRDSELTATDTRIRFLRPDVAAVDVRWQMMGARDPHDNAWPLRKGLISLVCTQERETWAIAAMHNMDLPPDELAQAQEDLQHRP